MLSTYIEVNEIVKEELVIAMNNGNNDSALRKLCEWTNDLPQKVLCSSSQTFSSVAKAALQHCGDTDSCKGGG